MGKYFYLILMGILGISISAFGFYKGGITLSEISQFAAGKKSFSEVFVESKIRVGDPVLVSIEKSYLTIESYNNIREGCAKLNMAGNFVRNYVADFISLNIPLNQQIKSIRLLKEYDSFILSKFIIVEFKAGSNTKKKFTYIRSNKTDCDSSLQIMSDIVFKIASESSKNKIKKLSGFVESKYIRFFEYENIVVSYPFIFYFENGNLFDFKYVNSGESLKALDYFDKNT
ncbi:hypothetical protein [Colwellia piezophila]|uniref:hypothetical protein n=1 Tax=Colwellia piezophila TaxID=211668 RepID=UPI00037183C1|nr:hypothetical protein [Colwellia piezophila]